MANILDILTRAQALRQETALNSITPDRAGGIMYDTLILINQMQLEGGSLLISKVYSSVAAMEADTTPTSDLTGRALRPGQLAVIVPSSSSSSDMGSVYRYNEPGSWTLCGKIGGLPLDTAPIQGSSNGITSGAVYTALSALRNEGYKYMGIATPGSGGTAPGTPNQPVFYIAGPGSYPNFGSITVAAGYLGFIKYSGGSWSVESVAVGKDYDEEISQLQQKVDELDGEYLSPDLQLEQGTIYTNGVDLASATRIRTSNFINADAISITTSGNKVKVFGYTEDGTFLESSDYISTSQVVRIPSADKYRIIFAFSNDSSISVSDYASLGITIRIAYDNIVAKKTGNSFTDKAVSVTFTDGKYITATGAVASNTSYKYGVFSANRGDMIVVAVKSTSIGCIIGVAETASATTFSPVVKASGVGSYSFVCEKDCYVGISGLKPTIKLRVVHSRIDDDIQRVGSPYSTKRLFPTYTITNGEYINVAGSISTNSSYARTSAIELKKGTAIQYNMSVVADICSVISEVTAGGVFIRSLYRGDGVAGTKNYVIDKDGYYVFSCIKGEIDRFVIVEYANGALFFNPPLDRLFLPMEDTLPREILRTSSFVGIVHKWGFIGDSLSSGEQAVKQDGTSTIVRFDKYEYSWGQRMCALNGVDGFNFSAGGQTAKGWCNGTGVRTWGGAMLEENWKEAYCIAMGVNDSASISAGDADTDIDLSDYTNNADTFAGWYAGIIQRLRSVNPKCRIFCITIPYNQTAYNNFSQVIRDVCAKFTRCYLVDLANYHWTPNGLALNDHLSPAGYQWAAWEINTYIDWIIRNNMDDFKDIAFVGTDYSA